MKVDLLGSLLIPLIDSKYAALANSEKTSTRFFDSDYLDLGQYLDKLAGQDLGSDIAAAVKDIKELYMALVLFSQFAFNRPNQQSAGLSIYYPSKEDFDPAYMNLLFHLKSANWIQFLKKYHFIA